MIPQFQLGKPIRASIGVLTSGSVGEISRDFMLDLLPRLEVGILSHLTVSGEVAIGILQSDNNDKVRLSFYVSCQI